MFYYCQREYEIKHFNLMNNLWAFHVRLITDSWPKNELLYIIYLLLRKMLNLIWHRYIRQNIFSLKFYYVYDIFTGM